MPSPDTTRDAAPDRFDELAASNVVVFWRPGCGFCMMLRRGLRKAGLTTVEVDIWEDPDAAAFVRRHARGHETVPTVAVGGEVMVNPSWRAVVAAAARCGARRDQRLIVAPPGTGPARGGPPGDGRARHDLWCTPSEDSVAVRRRNPLPDRWCDEPPRPPGEIRWHRRLVSTASG